MHCSTLGLSMVQPAASMVGAGAVASCWRACLALLLPGQACTGNEDWQTKETARYSHAISALPLLRTLQIGEGVEELARIIEDGGRLPPPPPEEVRRAVQHSTAQQLAHLAELAACGYGGAPAHRHVSAHSRAASYGQRLHMSDTTLLAALQFLCAPEPLEQFRARIQASIDAYESGRPAGPPPPEWPRGLPGYENFEEEWTGPFHKVLSYSNWLWGAITRHVPGTYRRK